jgi:hypothetical protein
MVPMPVRMLQAPDVRVTWMPHTTLSQTSHVCLIVRSAHARLDPLEHYNKPEEWQTRIHVCALGGISLIPVIAYHTPVSPVKSRKAGDVHRPSVMSATHDCVWESFIQLPIRWRDLPRDAYFKFELLTDREKVVSA